MRPGLPTLSSYQASSDWCVRRRPWLFRCQSWHVPDESRDKPALVLHKSTPALEATDEKLAHRLILFRGGHSEGYPGTLSLEFQWLMMRSICMRITSLAFRTERKRGMANRSPSGMYNWAPHVHSIHGYGE